MFFKKFVSISCLAFLLIANVTAQPCTTLGQTPSTAFPVCGTDTFSQATVPYCGGRSVPGACNNDGLADLNPFWYKFTCFESGTLGFVITPNDLDDDYDWQIFDVTNRPSDDVFSDPGLFVACNWSGRFGLTGTSAAGQSLINCAGQTYPTFSKMPDLIKGHEYLLLISHFTRFTPSQNGYSLSFGGGTASITDTLSPTITRASVSCDAKTITLQTNKLLRCASLAADGSDFTLSAAGYKFIAAKSVSCSGGFDLDSISLETDKPLPPGKYSVSVKNGSDGNSVLDYCNTGITVGDAVSFEVFDNKPTPLDSIVPPTCAPKSIQLVFQKNILCNSVSPDGSDFVITGPSLVNITSAGGSCVNGKSNVITLNFLQPIVTGGLYQVSLQQSIDGNTIIDECLQQTPPSTIAFTLKDTVSADFTFAANQSCKFTTTNFKHPGRNGVSEWTWEMDTLSKSALQNPVVVFNTYGDKVIRLAVTNDFCSDSSIQTINIGNELKALFDVSNTICPEDSAVFHNNSIGNITSYTWDMGDGTASSLEFPEPKFYTLNGIEKIYPVRLIVKNDLNCYDTAVNPIKVLKSCYIAVPTAFTPDGDGLNDFLYPLNAFQAGNLDFKVYNRIGQLLFHSTDWRDKWDGKFKGEPQNSGIYVWMLSFTNLANGRQIFQKGSTILVR